ncbi:MAG: 1-(5-phosphoribosyl)-5-[(5-phosphoribosylamino)methylideneamino]imidazole-4-carboxamide isomerase [Chloroflexota bacterium]|nr:1-(5-phosphoribosyl)-5-[(5-phosphoribosylamino)methylideneamino]imidazole-4-carboxamide isomerase [Chloroflexota bacterium]
MIVFPAIDLRQGRCVRLKQGDPDAETLFSNDPVAIARQWAAAGAQWLHVVNLDGAIGDQKHDAPNLVRLQEIGRAVSLPIQFGGGLRTLDDVNHALALGAARVVLGTAAVQNPELLSAAIERFGPQAVVVGLDARNGVVATHGWQQSSGRDVVDLARLMADRGVERVVYTDIARDGMLSGVDSKGTARLADECGLKVIASGGVRDMEDIRRLQALEARGIEGVIVGQALYTGALALPDALRVADGFQKTAASDTATLRLRSNCAGKTDHSVP